MTTELKEASSSRGADFFARSPFGVALLDADHRILQANQVLVQMLGLSISDIQSRRLTDFWSSGAAVPTALGFRYADGSPGSARLFLWPIDERSFEHSGAATIALVEDVTASVRLRAEEDRSSLRRLSSIIAHHVRNPLAGITGALNVLRDRLDLSDEDSAIIEEIIDRLAELNDGMDDIVLFSSSFAASPSSLSALELIQDIVGQFRCQNHFDVEIKLPAASDDMAVWTDSHLFSRCLTRILLNSAEAMRGRGTIAITLRKVWDADGQLRCAIELVDDGPGCSADTAEHIFEPFFTTKSKHIGLGLSITRRILEALGGDVTYNREHPGGMALTISLPASPRAD